MFEHVIMVRDTKLDGVAKTVGFALASRANETGRAWPTLDTLVEDTGLSARSVQRGLTSLAESSVIETDRRKGRRQLAVKFAAPDLSTAAGRYVTQSHRDPRSDSQSSRSDSQSLKSDCVTDRSNKKLKEGAPAAVHKELQRLANEKAGLELAEPRDEDTIRDVQARIDHLLRGEP